MKKINLLGNIYGMLTVVGEAEQPLHVKRKQIHWLCKCSCGNEKITLASSLESGRIKSCGCLNKLNLLGNRYGMLTVIMEAKNPLHIKYKRIHWICQCDCGNEKVVRTYSLTTGHTKSCGCSCTITNKEEAIIASAKHVFRSYYNDGNLKFEDFYKMSQLSCAYCGTKASDSLNKINIFINSKTSRYASEFAMKNGLFQYNGLDRVDSLMPHNLNNVVPCCRTCNRFKIKLSTQEFLKKILQLNTNINIIYIKDIKISKNMDDYKKLYPYRNNGNENFLLSKISGIKKNAKIRKLYFNLTKEQVAQLVTSNCIYCNHLPNPEKLKYNGIDRLNNLKGYTGDNCVSACVNCNVSKNDMTFEQFISWINVITSFQKLQIDTL